MAFHLYFAGQQCKEAEDYMIERGCCRLFSQLNEKASIRYYESLEPERKKPEMLIDSGAFSVAHAGATANMEQHIEYINQNDDFIEHWVEMDDICMNPFDFEQVNKCADKSWQNYLYYLDKIKSPEKLIPVFHHGEPYEKLERMLNTRIPELGDKPAPYIGISRVHVGACTASNYIPYFENIFRCVKNSINPNVKIHAFGITALKLLERYPFYSADSTSWLQTGAVGGIMTDFGIVNVSDRSKDKSNIYNLSKDDRRLIEMYIQERGYNLEELSKDYKKRMIFNIDYMQDWAEAYQYRPVTVHNKKLF